MPPVAHRPAAADRRLDILKSAAAAFRRRGYHGASVDGIAGALAMTKGNLYYYFRDKAAILCACHDYSLDVLQRRLAEVRSGGGPPDAQLRTLVVSLVHLSLDELQGTALTLDPQTLSPALRQTVVARREEFDRGVRAIVQDGMDQGLFVAGDAALVVLALLGAVNAIARSHDAAGPATSHQIAAAFAEYVVGGLVRRHAPAAG